MKLSTKEFDAMQMGWRKLYIEKVELKTFEKFGLRIKDADILDFCILHHVEGWRTFFDESRRVLKDGGCIYAADLSKRCIHMVDAILHWGHVEEALFTLKEFEEEAKKRGFRTVRKANDLSLEGYFRFQKE